jgi:hypothetical protein
MHNSFIKKYYLRIAAVTLACLIHMAVWAQDSSGYLDSPITAPGNEDTVITQVTSEDGNTELFDTIKEPLQVVVRKIPDTVVSQLRKDENYWYVNKAPEREKKKDPTGKHTKWYQGAWFTQLLWFLVLGSFLAIMIWFLASSNISLFRKKNVAIKDIEEMDPDENIFTLDYGKELHKALAENNFRLAIRLWYLSTLKDLSEKEYITYKSGKTNSDYVAQLYNTPLYRDFSTLTRVFEYTWYGELALNHERYALLQKDFEIFKEQLAQ